MPSVLGTGFTHAGENFYVRGPRAAWWRALSPVPMLIHCHAYTETAATGVTAAIEMTYFRLLAQHFLVVFPDMGGDLFGSDTALARIEETRLAVLAAYNVSSAAPVGLSGISEGAGAALAYARANPTLVGFVAGIVPLLDIADIRDNNRGGAAAAINTAYGGTYNDTTDGPTHSPVKFAASMSATLSVALWTSSNDTVTVPATADAFVAARPQTARTDLGAVGHAPSALTDTGIAAMAAWCIAHKP